MPRLDSLSRDTFPQPGSLSGKIRRAKADLKTASGRGEPVKGRQHEVMQHRLERDRRIFCQCIPQCQRTMRRQLGDQPIRQRPGRILIIFFSIGSTTRDRDHRALDGSALFLTFGRQRTGVLPDFFIGAHAEVERLPLLTRDARRYRTYFPNVTLIAPEGR